MRQNVTNQKNTLSSLMSSATARALFFSIITDYGCSDGIQLKINSTVVAVAELGMLDPAFGPFKF